MGTIRCTPPIAPSYYWSRTYMAAKDMDFRATEDGFDVLASDGLSDGASPLVHVVVDHEHTVSRYGWAIRSSPLLTVSAWRAIFCARAVQVSGSYGPGLVATSNQCRSSPCQLQSF